MGLPEAHQAKFEQEGSYDLSSVFHQMVISTNLLNTKVHEVQETWGGQKNLRTTNQVARASLKDLHFFPHHLTHKVTKDHGP